MMEPRGKRFFTCRIEGDTGTRMPVNKAKAVDAGNGSQLPDPVAGGGSSQKTATQELSHLRHDSCGST